MNKRTACAPHASRRSGAWRFSLCNSPRQRSESCWATSPTHPNVGSTWNSEFGPKKPKRTLECKKKNEEEDQKLSEAEIVVSSIDQPPKCAYSNRMYRHLQAQEMEVNRRPLPNYMETVQNNISAYMRETLVDWLVEVAEEYKLVPDTFYRTYEEISPLHVEDLCYITDNTYTKEEVVDMERDVLRFLNFEMGTPTTKTFLRIFMMAAQENCNSLALQCYSGYRPSDLKECVLAIHDLQLNRKGSSLQAVREKYRQHKFKCVATLTSPSEIPACYFESIDG